MNLDEKTLEKCVERFRTESRLLAVWGLGSAFGGAWRVDSDVDFAVLPRSQGIRDFRAEGELVADLEAIVKRRVDVGFITTRNLVYANQAIRNGILVFARDPEAVNEFVGRLFSLYPDFKRDRKVVEEAYRG